MLQRKFSSIKSGRYNERGGILFIMESSILVFTRERSFMLFMCVRLFMLFIRESLFIVFTKERLCFSDLHVQCMKVKLILHYFYTDIFDFVLYFSCLNGCVGW
jgi:hypothetical protein